MRHYKYWNYYIAFNDMTNLCFLPQVPRVSQYWDNLRVLTEPGEVDGPVRQAERLLLLLLLQSSAMFFVVFLRVLWSLVERRDVTDCVTHLVHARSLTTVPHGKPDAWPLFHMVDPPGLSDFQRFEAPLCAPVSSMALLFGLACKSHHAPLQTQRHNLPRYN